MRRLRGRDAACEALGSGITKPFTPERHWRPSRYLQLVGSTVGAGFVLCRAQSAKSAETEFAWWVEKKRKTRKKRSTTAKGLLKKKLKKRRKEETRQRKQKGKKFSAVRAGERPCCLAVYCCAVWCCRPRLRRPDSVSPGWYMPTILLRSHKLVTVKMKNPGRSMPTILGNGTKLLLSLKKFYPSWCMPTVPRKRVWLLTRAMV